MYTGLSHLRVFGLIILNYIYYILANSAFLNLVYFFVYFASFICCQRISICEDELSFGEGRFDFIFISKISAASISSFIGFEGKLNIILSLSELLPHQNTAQSCYIKLCAVQEDEKFRQDLMWLLMGISLKTVAICSNGYHRRFL